MASLVNEYLRLIDEEKKFLQTLSTIRNSKKEVEEKLKQHIKITGLNYINFQGKTINLKTTRYAPKISKNDKTIYYKNLFEKYGISPSEELLRDAVKINKDGESLIKTKLQVVSN